jgi:hypothetical protein
MAYSLRAMGSMTSNLPIIITSYGETAVEAQDGANSVLATYPAPTHGTTQGPVVRSVAGPFKCTVYLIPGDKGDPAKWGLLKC